MTAQDPAAVLNQPGIVGAEIVIDNVSKQFGGTHFPQVQRDR